MLLQRKGPHQRPFFSAVHMLLVAREGPFAKRASGAEKPFGGLCGRWNPNMAAVSARFESL